MVHYLQNDFPVLETDRLILRALSLTDCHAILEIFSNEEVMRYYGMFAINGLESAISLIEALQSTYYEKRGIRWAVVLKETGELIGTCGFHNLNEFHRRSELGYELSEAFWHKGYASELLNAIMNYGMHVMNLNRMEALVYKENEASQNLLTRSGFVYEGTLKSYAYFRNQYTDLLVYSFINPNHQRRAE